MNKGTWLVEPGGNEKVAAAPVFDKHTGRVIRHVPITGKGAARRPLLSPSHVEPKAAPKTVTTPKDD
jgi:hypothetical protein